jgi:hypothetical protein
VRARTEALLDDLASGLPDELVEAAGDRGRGKTLDEIVHEALQML